ncbi:MAG: class I SAM-dependent methyltransferase [Verrucomicrobiales bacterium]|nr:class I SAM-dependent methyltransferase [Verrucomicrobiales bacterium]
MKKKLFWSGIRCWALVVACWGEIQWAEAAEGATPPPAVVPQPLYTYREEHDPNGIGKFFMGREIAYVMGHQAADWLERPSREAEEKTSRLLPLLKLKPGDQVADIGAGTGYLTRRMAGLVSPGGRIFAVDIQPEMLVLLTNKLSRAGITNVIPVLGEILDPKLPPASLDFIIMVDVYHEFSHPYEMTVAMCRALKTGGRLAFVEFRKEDPLVPIKEVHKMSEAQVRAEMALHPLEWVETLRDLPSQHLIVFRKR